MKNAGKDGEGGEEKRVDSSLLLPVVFLDGLSCQFGSWFVPVFDFVLFSFCFFVSAFHITILALTNRRKSGPFGDNVFKNPARYK